jgi:hypothetical protein
MELEPAGNERPVGEYPDKPVTRDAKGRYVTGTVAPYRSFGERQPSFAEQVRRAGTDEQRQAMLQHIWHLAAADDTEPSLRLRVAEWLAKFGWPMEWRQASVAAAQEAAQEGMSRRVVIELIDTPAPSPAPKHDLPVIDTLPSDDAK